MSDYSLPRAIAVFAGKRDNYQLPIALHEVDLLQKLVTDLYWPADRRAASCIASLLPERLISSRFDGRLPSNKVRVSAAALGAFVASRASSRDLSRQRVQALGRMLYLESRANPEAAIFSHFAYAYHAFLPRPDNPKYRFLSFYTAHPRSLRQLLFDEIDLYPIAKSSLMRYAEMTLTESEIQDLCNEAEWANGCVAPTMFVARTLIDNNIPVNRIHVIPYGVDTRIFTPRSVAPSKDHPLTISFVGSVVQLKGVIYLLEAIRQLNTRHVRLLLLSRKTIHEELLTPYSDLDIEVYTGLEGQGLAEKMKQADVSVFPSLAEGFGHVVLENMACGVPVIASDHTCAPDVLEDGKQGFIVPIRSANAIAERLEWCLNNREELEIMGNEAVLRSRGFSWDLYRSNIQIAYKNMIASVDACL